MASKFHLVSPAVWSKELRRASRDAQVVAFYVWTCRARISEGLFELALGQVALDCGMTEAEAHRALDELGEASLVDYDHEAEVVLDRRALRDNPLRNGVNPKTGEVRVNGRIPRAVDLMDQQPDTPLKVELVRLAIEHAPDFAGAIALRHPQLYRQAEAPGGAGDPPGGVRGGRGGETHPHREELVTSGVRLRPVVPCAWCGEEARVEAGEIQVGPDEEPWCGWCDVDQPHGSRAS